MNWRSWTLATAAACAAAFAFAGPPLAGVWNIAPSGRAGSSGDLHFRITQSDGSDPVDITVPVIVGAKDQTIARSIRNSLGSQLRRDRFKVELGEGTNVLVSDQRGQPNFAIELVDSDIEELRVAVQSVTPSAPPTVPTQSAPAVPPGNPPAAPAPTPVPSPGEAAPQPGSATPLPGAGMGIPDTSAPRLPNTSPPATPPATPPMAPAPQPSPASPPPNKPSDSSGGAGAPPPTVG
jgi:hypothetical protein